MPADYAIFDCRHYADFDFHAITRHFRHRVYATLFAMPAAPLRR